ncbi:hypothetical protein HPB48_019400 [Haemaphysalis longicornis]|uniref:Uncharacterized protein n=1 Tax=Haemaphysalis longicornis TaxID=44386 RepID=A0A9J6GM99_HAELO|nr:hypothetical protein HPB48_019400 [Haemaphysalis longicornis]
MKIRINEDQNILVASTPYQSAASVLSKIKKLTIGETIYAIASYGISPGNSCKGVIHNIHKEATTEEIMEAISALGYRPPTCRRLCDSSAILITSMGKKVPFTIYVGGVETAPSPLHRMSQNRQPHTRMPSFTCCAKLARTAEPDSPRRPPSANQNAPICAGGPPAS